MSIASEITRIQHNISAAYDACEEKGATMPDKRNSNHLSDTIHSVPTAGEEDIKKAQIMANWSVGLNLVNDGTYTNEKAKPLLEELYAFLNKENVTCVSQSYEMKKESSSDPVGLIIIGVDGDSVYEPSLIIRPLGIHDTATDLADVLPRFPSFLSDFRESRFVAPDVVMCSDDGGVHTPWMCDYRVEQIAANSITLYSGMPDDEDAIRMVIDTGDVNFREVFRDLKSGTLSEKYIFHEDYDDLDLFMILGKF